METKTTCDWIGKSGRSYQYHVYTLPQSFDKNQNGNYIYTKVVNNKWVPIYIGEGDLGERVGDNHHQIFCIKSKQATHVHAHLNPLSDSKAEESDLLAAFPQAYKPNGCNEKIGG